MCKQKQESMDIWLVRLNNVTEHDPNDRVLAARSRAFNREAEKLRRLISEWKACDAAHSTYTGM